MSSCSYFFAFFDGVTVPIGTMRPVRYSARFSRVKKNLFPQRRCPILPRRAIVRSLSIEICKAYAASKQLMISTSVILFGIVVLLFVLVSYAVCLTMWDYSCRKLQLYERGETLFLHSAQGIGAVTWHRR